MAKQVVPFDLAHKMGLTKTLKEDLIIREGVRG
jgi:hypothetical protein